MSALEIKRDEKKGRIWSHVRSKWLVETPEETVRQEYLLVLVNEYGFALDQIAEEMDLTGHRPNVYVEAGYALKHHESNRLIFLFEPSGAGDQVPFVLNTFKYVPITQAAEIPNRLTPELESILQSAGALLGEGAT